MISFRGHVLTLDTIARGEMFMDVVTSSYLAYYTVDITNDSNFASTFKAKVTVLVSKVVFIMRPYPNDGVLPLQKS